MHLADVIAVRDLRDYHVNGREGRMGAEESVMFRTNPALVIRRKAPGPARRSARAGDERTRDVVEAAEGSDAAGARCPPGRV